MKQKRINYSIVPIFNQAAPMVWDDFINIEIECDKAIYNLDAPSQTVIKNRLRDYRNNLQNHKHNFAFGAYYKQRMIGFIQGYSIDPDDAWVHHLYILPEYHRYGIGTQLLNAAEQSVWVVAKQISLVSLGLAIDFYERKHDYTKSAGEMEKELAPVANAVLPVFQWIKQDIRPKIIAPHDTKVLKQSKYQPIFVHTNACYKIDAVATRINGVNKIWTAGDISTPESKIYSQQLLQELNKVR